MVEKGALLNEPHGPLALLILSRTAFVVVEFGEISCPNRVLVLGNFIGLYLHGSVSVFPLSHDCVSLLVLSLSPPVYRQPEFTCSPVKGLEIMVDVGRIVDSERCIIWEF